MSGYTDSYKEELVGLNLVISGCCTMQDLWETMSYEDVVKLTEAIMLKSEIEGLAMGTGK